MKRRARRMVLLPALRAYLCGATAVQAAFADGAAGIMVAQVRTPASPASPGPAQPNTPQPAAVPGSAPQPQSGAAR